MPGQASATNSLPPDTADFLVMGGGIIGIALAADPLEIPESAIVLIEKEQQLASDASGLLHAGFYYSATASKRSSPRTATRRRLCTASSAGGE